MPASVDILNKNDVAKGYDIGDPAITPDSVDVTGGEDMINSIAFIKGVVSVEGLNQTVNKSVTLNAYDANGNQLNVAIDPATVNVQVPIFSVSKNLPIKLIEQGSPADGYQIDGMDPNVNKVTIFADRSILDKIDTIPPIEVPVDGLTSDKTVKVNVPIPKGVESISPETISVDVQVSKSADNNKNNGSKTESGTESTDKTTSTTDSDLSTKEFNAVPIQFSRADSTKTLTFEKPSNKKIDVTVTGKNDDLKKLSSSDITASIDVSDLDNGVHEVPIKLTMPKGFEGSALPKYATVKISDHSSDTST
ncbi:CdaR family protein [Terrilactibacillus laevilacticus]|uniref:CdaR family protein n=1 Tax=Terrilactibacillus laevilacticus TaxID=1380157 RepID=UPI00114664ED|nr:CdaR family protein [Terrilactibacillus laevilacticus]